LHLADLEQPGQQPAASVTRGQQTGGQPAIGGQPSIGGQPGIGGRAADPASQSPSRVARGQRRLAAARQAEAAWHKEPAAHAEAAVRRRFVAYYLALAERFESAPPTDQLARYLREAEYWLDQVAGRCPERSAPLARVLSTRAYIRVLLGDFPSGQADAETAVAMAATFGDVAVGGRGYSALHRALAFSGSLDEAQQAGRSAAACLTSAGDVLGLAQLDVVDAMLQLQAGDPAGCCQSASRGLGRITDDELWCAAQLHGMLALGLFLQGGIDGAQTPAGQALEMQHLVGDVMGIAFSLGTLAFIAAGERRYQRTAWLLGASTPLWERTGRWYTGSPAFESLHQVAERVACTSLGDDQFWRLRAAGAAAPLDHAVALALSDADSDDQPS
jgi:hypothetical protein